MNNTPMRQALIGLTKKIAVKRGKFKLAGGGTSDFYVDMRLVTLHPQGAFTVGRLVFDMAMNAEPGLRAVAGPAVSGVPITTAVTVISLQKNTPIFGLVTRPTAKDHGTMSPVEGGDNVPAGAPVVLVDDVLTSGSSLLKAVETLRDAGYRVSHAVVLLHRNGIGRDRLKDVGVTVHACMHPDDLGV